MMADEYISREAALKYIKSKQCRTCSDIGLCGNCAVLVAVKLLEKVPAADVAPVVRCKDCQKWKRNVGLTDSPNGHCFEHDIDTNKRDFCSYGERMRQAKREAEKLICENRERLMTPSCEGERGMEGE